MEYSHCIMGWERMKGKVGRSLVGEQKKVTNLGSRDWIGHKKSDVTSELVMIRKQLFGSRVEYAQSFLVKISGTEYLKLAPGPWEARVQQARARSVGRWQRWARCLLMSLKWFWRCLAPAEQELVFVLRWNATNSHRTFGKTWSYPEGGEQTFSGKLYFFLLNLYSLRSVRFLTSVVLTLFGNSRL